MPFDIDAARKEGYSDSEIADYLGQQNKFDIGAARKEGYSDSELISHLTKTEQPAPVVEQAKPEPIKPLPEDESFSTLRHAADIPLKTTTGLISGIKMISDAFGANNVVSKNLQGAEHYVADLMSAQAKNDSAKVQEILDEAKDKGVYDQLKSGIQAFSVAPVGMLANALGTAAPAIIAALGSEFLGPAAFLTSAGVGATMGAGTLKGSIYDAVKEELSKTNMPADQIEARAQLAQNYNGKNLDMILAGAAFGTLGATSGVEASIARQAAKNILGKAAAKEEIGTVAKQKAAELAESQVQEAAKRGVVGQGIRTGLTEFGTEYGQAAQENMAQNLALQREGFDVPLTRGVFGEAAMEGLAGFGLGSITGGLEARQAKNIVENRKLAQDIIDSQQKKEEPVQGELFTTTTEDSADDILASELSPKGTVTLGPVEQATIGPPAPEKEFSSVLDADTLKSIGLTPRSGIYKKLIDKDVSKPEDQAEVASVLADVRNNSNFNKKAKEAIERVANNAYGALATQQDMFNNIGEQNDGTIVEPDRTSAEIPQQNGPGTTTEGTTPVNDGRMGATDITEEQPGEGKTTEQPTLKETEIKEPEAKETITPEEKQTQIDTLQKQIAFNEDGIQFTTDPKERLQLRQENIGLRRQLSELQNPKLGLATGAVSDKLTEHLNTGNFTRALREIADNTNDFTPVENLVAKRILSNKMFTMPKFELVDPAQLNGDSGMYSPLKDTVYLSKDAMHSHSVLHEAVHSFLHAAIHEFENKRLESKALKDLKAIYDHVLKTAPELKDAYGMQSLSEFASEVMSNREFQDHLKAIPYRRENIFTEFARAVMRLLGLADTDKVNAFGSAIMSVESAMNAGRHFQETKVTGRGLEVPSANLPANKPQPQGKKKAPFLEVNDVYAANPSFAVPPKYQKRKIADAVKQFFSHGNVLDIVKTIQNAAYRSRNLELQIIRAKALNDYGPEVNNFHTQDTLSSTKGVQEFVNNVQTPLQDLEKAIVDLSKEDNIVKASEKANEEARKKDPTAKDRSPVEYLQGVLHIYGQAFTDVERRLNMFVQTAPLNNTNKTERVGNTLVTPADLRDMVFGNPANGREGILSKNLNLTPQQARDLYLRVRDLALTTDANGNSVPNTKNVVPGGYSPTGNKEIDFKTDKGNTEYNVTGFTYQETEKILAQYDNDPNKPMLDKIFNHAWKLGEVAFELNKKSNYASRPASNWKNAYGYKNYLPLKGITSQNDASRRIGFEFDGPKLSNELLQTAIKSEGRFTVSDNPVLQVMTDSMMGAMRAGKGPEYTLSVKNLIKQGWVKGEIAQTIPFAERSVDTLKEVGKDNVIFHHNEDGSIDVLKISDPKMLESIRRPFKDRNKLVEWANAITSGLGQSHTRYNVNFAPINFTRDALTNAWNIGAQFGPVEGAKMVQQIVSEVATQNSLAKAFKLAKAYKTPEFEKFKNSTDPLERNMHELVSVHGGMVEYMESISLKSNLEKLIDQTGRNRILKAKDQIDSVVDIWTNMFELASRSAAYGLIKQRYMTKDKLDDKAAGIRAASYVKNLANFEQVGTAGKLLGAYFMFFRPSATGAVRALEPLTPLLPGSLNRAVANAPEKIKNDPELLAQYKATYKDEQASVRWQTLALTGLGMLAYTMSYMMADKDDEDRNKVLTDDMSQWTRYWRVYIPGQDKPFQMPWGFGHGSFMAMGAQMGAWANGQQSFGGVVKNSLSQIALDSFAPIPVSRMDITDSPTDWFLDTIFPSAIRPVVEFAINKNGLGQDIYNDASGRKMGDAYLGGDHIPQSYKEIAVKFARWTDGYIDMPPNALYFLVNSYADGPGRLMDYMVNSYYFATGGKEFEAKTDLPFVGSYIGAAPNVDSREFSSIEKQVEKIRRNVNEFKKNDPDFYYDQYLERHPDNPGFVAMYDKSIGRLNKLRQQATAIQGSRDYDLKEKKELIKDNREQQNYLKHMLVEMYKEEGIKP